MPTNVIIFISNIALIHSEGETCVVHNFAYSIFLEQVWVGVLHTVRAQKGWRSKHSAVHMHNSGRTIYLQVYFNLRKRGRHLLKPFYDENYRFMLSQKYYDHLYLSSFWRTFFYKIIYLYSPSYMHTNLLFRHWI